MMKLYDTEGQEANFLVNDLEDRGAKFVVPYLTDRVSENTTSSLESAPDLPNSDEVGDLTVYWGNDRVVMARK